MIQSCKKKKKPTKHEELRFVYSDFVNKDGRYIMNVCVYDLSKIGGT